MQPALAAVDPFLDDLTRTLAERLRPQRIVLFGSRARGEAHEYSDYDIMVEMETDGRESDRQQVVHAALGGRPRGVEFFVYTPSEFERTRDDVGTLAYQIQREGRVVFRAPGIAEEGAAAAPTRIRERRPGPPRSLAAWVRRAENSFRAMEQLYAARAPVWDAVCFHAHDGAEKVLKAMLVANHTPPPRIHDLNRLLGMCPDELRASVEAQAACDALAHVWPKSRYPDEDKGIPSPDDWDPTAEDGEQSVAAARALRRAIRPLLERIRR